MYRRWRWAGRGPQPHNPSSTIGVQSKNRSRNTPRSVSGATSEAKARTGICPVASVVRLRRRDKNKADVRKRLPRVLAKIVGLTGAKVFSVALAVPAAQVGRVPVEAAARYPEQ